MNPEIFQYAPVTIGLIVANVVLSVVGLRNHRLIDQTLLDVGRIRRDKQYQRLVTSGFVHGDMAHLSMNMLSLFFIGPYLEAGIGSGPYLALYFACLIGGSGWAVLENWRNPNYRALGASGAVSGVLTAFSLFAPFALFFGFIPAVLYTGLYIGWSAYATGRVNDGIGHAAHLGGALTGVAMVCLFWPEAVRALWTGLMSYLP